MKKNTDNQNIKQKTAFVKALRKNGYLFPISDSEIENLDRIAKKSKISIPDSLLNPPFLRRKGKNETELCARKTTYAALQILKNVGGQLPEIEVIRGIEKNKVVKFTVWEKEKLKKTGKPRWQSILRSYFVGLMKAGFILKEPGMWTLTENGDTATKLSPEKLFEKTSLAYNKWIDKSK